MHKGMRLVSLTTAILIAFSFLLLSGCVQTQQQKLIDSGAKQLNDMELKELVTDSVNTWSNPRGDKGKTVYRSDGTATAEWNGPNGSGADQGTWVVKNDSVCTTWTKVRNGKEMCFTMYRVGDNEYKGFRPDGTEAGTHSFSKM